MIVSPRPPSGGGCCGTALGEQASLATGSFPRDARSGWRARPVRRTARRIDRRHTCNGTRFGPRRRVAHHKAPRCRGGPETRRGREPTAHPGSSDRRAPERARRDGTAGRAPVVSAMSPKNSMSTWLRRFCGPRSQALWLSSPPARCSITRSPTAARTRANAPGNSSDRFCTGARVHPPPTAPAWTTHSLRYKRSLKASKTSRSASGTRDAARR